MADNTLRTHGSEYRAAGEGIVRPVSKETEQLSRRLHQTMPPVMFAGGLFLRCNGPKGFSGDKMPLKGRTSG